MDENVEKFFWQADSDRSGNLTLQELRTALAKNGYTMSDAEFKGKFSQFDSDNDGSIEYHEFLQGMGYPIVEVHRQSEIRRVFQIFDKTRKGYIRRDDIRRVFREYLNKEMTSKEVDNIMRVVDKDKSQRIEMDEFITVFSNMKYIPIE